MNRPILIGLTGTIGSGKSTVARMFEELGAYRIDADELAHEVIRKGSPAYDEVVREFGKDILDRRGRIIKKRLRRLVFAEPQLKRKLEAIIHPKVAEAIARRIRWATRMKKKAVVIEVPLLFEVGLEGMFDCVVAVVCDESTLKRRAAERDRESAGEIERILQSQLPQDEKARRADFVIDNSSSVKRTAASVRKIWREIIDRYGHA